MDNAHEWFVLTYSAYENANIIPQLFLSICHTHVIMISFFFQSERPNGVFFHKFTTPNIF